MSKTTNYCQVLNTKFGYIRKKDNYICVSDVCKTLHLDSSGQRKLIKRHKINYKYEDIPYIGKNGNTQAFMIHEDHISSWFDMMSNHLNKNVFNPNHVKPLKANIKNKLHNTTTVKAVQNKSNPVKVYKSNPIIKNNNVTQSTFEDLMKEKSKESEIKKDSKIKLEDLIEGQKEKQENDVQGKYTALNSVGDKKVFIRNLINKYVMTANIQDKFSKFYTMLYTKTFNDLNIDADDIYDKNKKVSILNKICNRDDASLILDTLFENVIKVIKNSQVSYILKG